MGLSSEIGDGKHLASSDDDDHAMVFAARNGQIVRRFGRLEIPGNSIGSSADSRRVATGNGNSVLFWNVAIGEQVLDIRDDRDAQHSMKFNADCRLLVVRGSDWCVRVLDATHSMELLKVRDHKREVLGVVFKPDGKRVASLGGEGVARVWDASNARDVAAFDIGNLRPFQRFSEPRSAQRANAWLSSEGECSEGKESEGVND